MEYFINESQILPNPSLCKFHNYPKHYTLECGEKPLCVFRKAAENAAIDDDDDEHGAIRIQLAAAANLEQIESDIAEIVAEAAKQVAIRRMQLIPGTEHVVATHDDDYRQAEAKACTTTASTHNTPDDVDELDNDDNIDDCDDDGIRIAAPTEGARSMHVGFDSSAVRTIRKHSKLGQHPQLAAAATTIQRPNVGDIEWQPLSQTTQQSYSPRPAPRRVVQPPTTTSFHSNASESVATAVRPSDIGGAILSTLLLDDVIEPTSPLEHRSTEPVVIMSPSDDYSGEIDEVILVQTPGDDDEEDRDADGEGGGDEDEYDDDDDANNKYVDRQRRRRQQQHHGDNGNRVGVVTTEEHYPNGDIKVVQVVTSFESRQPIDEDRFHTTTTTTRTTTTRTNTLPVLQQQELQQQQNIRRPSDDNQSLLLKTSTTTTTTMIAPKPVGNIIMPSLSTQQQQQLDQCQQLVTFGSSSESDVALHEAGAEPSDDEPGT